MQLHSIADIVGDNAAHALSSVVTDKGRAVFIGAVGGALRLGDSTVTAARGVSIAQNTVFILPPDGSDISAAYPLSATYLYVPSGATATIAYAV